MKRHKKSHYGYGLPGKRCFEGNTARDSFQEFCMVMHRFAGIVKPTAYTFGQKDFQQINGYQKTD